MSTQIQRELIALAPIVTQTATDKGFWHEGETRSKGEMLMLMVSELGEALEAHRKNRYVDPEFRGFKPYNEWRAETLGTEAYYEDQWCGAFKNCVKDTVEDEMADVVIRILDYINGWKISYIEREYRKPSTGNFGHDLLRINHYLLKAFHAHVEPEGTDHTPGQDWGYALASIISFCQWNNIDILQHVRWKMRFNSNREHMHGKAY